MIANHFRFALHDALVKLGLSQHQFAESVKISQSVITRLLSGESAADDTFLKIFSFIRTLDNPEGLGIAAKLQSAWMHDLAIRCGVQDSSPERRERNSTDFVGSLFHRMPDRLILCLEELGKVAQRDENALNVLMGLAAALTTDPLAKAYFASGIVPTRPSGRMFRGQIGRRILELSARHFEADVQQPASE